MSLTRNPPIRKHFVLTQERFNTQVNVRRQRRLELGTEIQVMKCRMLRQLSLLNAPGHHTRKETTGVCAEPPPEKCAASVPLAKTPNTARKPAQLESLHSQKAYTARKPTQSKSIDVQAATPSHVTRVDGKDCRTEGSTQEYTA